MRSFSMCVAWCATIAAIARGQEAKSAGDRPIVVRQCSIAALVDRELSLQLPGIVKEVFVKKGDRVRANDQLLCLDDELAQLEYVAKKVDGVEDEADSTVVQSAKIRVEVAQAEFDVSEELKRTGTESQTEWRKNQARLKLSKAEEIEAFNQWAKAKIETRTAKKKIDLHRLFSPIDGEVVDVITHEGEAVEALKPVIRIINRDVVEVRGSIELADAQRVKKGMVVEVFPDTKNAPERKLLGHTGSVNAVVFIPGTSRCISAGADSQIIEWDVQSGEQVRVLGEHSGAAIHSLAITPKNPNRLVSGGSDAAIRVWDLAEGKLVRTIEGGGEDVLCLAINPADPDRCYSGHQDHSIREWNLQTGARTNTLQGHHSLVTGLSITADGRLLLSASDDQTIRFWDTSTAKEAGAPLRGRSTDVRRLQVSSDGSLYLFNNGENLYIRSVSDNRPLDSFTLDGAVFSDVAMFLPSSKLAISGTSNYQVVLWQRPEGGRPARLVRTYEGHEEPIRAMDVSSDGSRVVTASEDQSVCVWAIPSSDQIDGERLSGRISFLSPQVDPQQGRGMSTEIVQDSEVLQPGYMATLVIYPGAPIEEPATARVEPAEEPPSANETGEPLQPIEPPADTAEPALENP